MKRDPNISEVYRAQQIALHAARDDYGVASEKWAVAVSNIVNTFGIKSLIDYGCGKGRLLQAMKSIPLHHTLEVQLYDPAISKWSNLPTPAELVVCIDVAEHVEPEFTESFLDELARLAQRMVFITVHCGPAVKVLDDGRNAHLVQEPPAWWLPLLMRRFDLIEARRTEGGFVFMGSAINKGW